MTKTKKQINEAYRHKLAERGLVQMLIVVPEKDRERVKKYAARLRKDGG